MATTANEIDLQPDEGLSTLMEYMDDDIFMDLAAIIRHACSPPE
jgi:hypothetical protein